MKGDRMPVTSNRLWPKIDFSCLPQQAAGSSLLFWTMIYRQLTVTDSVYKTVMRP